MNAVTRILAYGDRSVLSERVGNSDVWSHYGVLILSTDDQSRETAACEGHEGYWGYSSSNLFFKPNGVEWDGYGWVCAGCVLDIPPSDVK